MLEVYADLHFHSTLSPCADITMTPVEILKRLIKLNIKMAALTDHNSSLNFPAFNKVFSSYGIYLIPGIEIQTSEEIHLLAYFKDENSLMAFNREIFKHLIKIKQEPDIFGEQLIVNKEDEFKGKFPYLLASSIDLNLEETLKLVFHFSGISIPSHIDSSFSLISQLGFIDNEKYHFLAYEIKNKDNIESIKNKFKSSHENIKFIRSSDAHYLQDFKKPHLKFFLEGLNFDEFLKALKFEDERGFVLT